MKAKSSGREERLAAALRENLKRRKARERMRAEGAQPEVPVPPQPRQNKAAKAD